jgi:folate-dependent phosphoribosylglycinamide formyltransferase PurN
MEEDEIHPVLLPDLEGRRVRSRAHRTAVTRRVWGCGRFVAAIAPFARFPES